jgi:crotonobetainyl-CoA:carnitine CoA-transferase CaiB-like acyl-CoA transferase
VGSEADGTETAAYYLAVNRNKRSIRVDLRHPEGAAILRDLLADADVLVENFRPGSLARLGFDDTMLEALNPRLVHLAITGYGTSGPAAERPGYDFVVQATSGLMSITGAADADGGSPTKVGVAISDVTTGMLGAVSVLAALLARAGTSGAGTSDLAGDAVVAGGQRIDISLLGSTLASLVNQAQNAFVTGVAPGRRGNAHPNIVPYETFETADGPIAVAVGSERQWRKLWQVLDLPEIATDQRFATNGGRVEHRAELRPLLAARLLERDRAAWLAALELRGIPCGPIRDVVEAFASPEAAALGMTVEQEHPAWGVIRQVGVPFQLSRTPASIRTPPPLLGQDTDEILASLGRTPEQVEALRRLGVV